MKIRKHYDIRVVVNDHYTHHHWAVVRPGAHGSVVGESNDRTCWWVKWDGLVTPSAISKSFVTEERHADRNSK